MSFTPTTVYGTCTPESFGAKGDGVTSDQAAFVAALAAMSSGPSKTLMLGAKTYLVTGSLVVPTLCNIIGVGESSVLTTATDAPVLQVNLAEDVFLSNFRIHGQTATSNQHGIACGNLGAGGQARLRIDGVNVDNLSRGMWFTGNNGGAAGPIVSNCRARGCSYNFYTDSGSEWVTFSNCQSYQASRGIHIGSGNISWIGGAINYNTIGVEIVSGSNDSHGIISGAHIDHNSTNVNVGAIANGFSFVGCNLFQGDIVINGNTGSIVDFVGCLLDPANYAFTNSLTRFLNCRLSSAYFASYTDVGTADTEWINCRHRDGTIPTYVGDRVHATYTFASDANQTLSAQLSRAQSIDIQNAVITTARNITLARPPSTGQEIIIVNRTAFTVFVGWATGGLSAVAAGSFGVFGGDGTNAIRRMTGGA